MASVPLSNPPLRGDWKESELEIVRIHFLPILMKLKSVRIGKGQNWKVLELESVRIGKCQNWKVSELESVKIFRFFKYGANDAYVTIVL